MLINAINKIALQSNPNCKIVYTSTTGIYYQQSIDMPFRSIVAYLQSNNSDFTHWASLGCQDTIAIWNDIENRVYRILAAEETCVKFY
jgi:hypothetical protein